MAKYAYSTEIGSYGDDVRLSISLELKMGGLSNEEYTALNAAFDTIEEIIVKHQELHVPIEE